MQENKSTDVEISLVEMGLTQEETTHHTTVKDSAHQ